MKLFSLLVAIYFVALFYYQLNKEIEVILCKSISTREIKEMHLTDGFKYHEFRPGLSCGKYYMIAKDFYKKKYELENN